MANKTDTTEKEVTVETKSARKLSRFFSFGDEPMAESCDETSAECRCEEGSSDVNEKAKVSRFSSYFFKNRGKKPLAQSAPELARPVLTTDQSKSLPLEVKEPLCRVVMAQSFRVKNCLQVCEGDVITLMDAEHLPKGQVIARND